MFLEIETPPTGEALKKDETDKDSTETTTTTTKLIGPENEPSSTDADLDSARNKPKPRVIKINIDKRLTISDLKNRLEPEVGISTDYFKIIRVYSNLQEFEYTRLGDTLSSFVDDVKVSSLLVNLNLGLGGPPPQSKKLWLIIAMFYLEVIYLINISQGDLSLFILLSHVYQ